MEPLSDLTEQHGADGDRPPGLENPGADVALDGVSTSGAAKTTIEIEVPPRRGQWRRAFLRILFTVGVLVVVFALVVPALSDVDYSGVWEAVRALALWELGVLAGVWVARVLAESAIHVSLTPALGMRRGVVSYLSTNAMSSTLPGPVDLVARFAMYREWGIDAGRSGVSVAASGIFSVGSKLVLPVIALAMLAVAGQANDLLIQAAVVGVIVLVVLATLVIAIVANESFARRLGVMIEQAAEWAFEKFDRVGPEVEARIIVLRRDAIDLLAVRWWKTALATASAVLTSYVLLLLLVRFVGIPNDALSWLQVFTAVALVQFASVIPVTGGNVGVAEVAYIASLSAFGGRTWVDEITAAVLIFRAFTWLAHIPIGWGTYLGWQIVRRRSRRGLAAQTAGR